MYTSVSSSQSLGFVHCFKEAHVRSSLARVIGVCFTAFVGMPLITTSSCASSDENDSVFTGGSGGKLDAQPDKGGGGSSGSGASGGFPSGGGSGGVTTGGGGAGGGGGTTGGTGGGGTGGSTGTCNPQTCPTPAAPAVKCCVTANGPCGVDYKQGAGCQVPQTGDI
ncbi:MAG: hypothetical protein IPI67_41270 [Myxococcales bacterium]|nr:hypothetical protein [Myxococcales bacterium]